MESEFLVVMSPCKRCSLRGQKDLCPEHCQEFDDYIDYVEGRSRTNEEDVIEE